MRFEYVQGTYYYDCIHSGIPLTYIDKVTCEIDSPIWDTEHNLALVYHCFDGLAIDASIESITILTSLVLL